MGAPAGLSERAMREVVDRHVFFADWLTGRLPETTLGGATRPFADGFRRIAPDGREMDRAALAAWLKANRGAMPDTFTIAIDGIRTIAEMPDCVALCYRETQAGQTPPVRIATALFVADDGAPNGVAWMHVHETWITDSGAETLG